MYAIRSYYGKPTDKIIAQFEQETGHKVIVDYGGAGKQMAKYQTVLRGDLFMPGSYFYINKLRITSYNVCYTKLLRKGQ